MWDKVAVVEEYILSFELEVHNCSPDFGQWNSSSV